MDRFVIEGGVPLRGEVRVSGAKNAALPVLAATILADGECAIAGAPDLRDISTMIRILGEVGVEVERDGDGVLHARTAAPDRVRAPYDLVRTMRASICVLGPLLARRGRAEVSFPGGCVIGQRPIDLHLQGLEALGAKVSVEGGYIVAEARRLRGAELFLGGAFGSTVTGTENVLMAAVLAEGTTVLEGAACEPEVADLANCLAAMGARIEGIGTPRMVVHGVEGLRGASHRVIPDRIEAGTFLAAAAITFGDVVVRGAENAHLAAALDALRRMGVTIERVEGGIRARNVERPRPVDLTTLPYPGFPTDLQAQFMAVLCTGRGMSLITEKVYPERFIHVAELSRMRAQIRKEGSTAIIQGVEYLSGAPVMASDLRASAALVLAGLGARGSTEVDRVYHIDRGYERIEERLAALGARIRRVAD